MNTPISTAREVCEAYLREQIASNAKHAIWPSENVVAERLLAHGRELEAFYEEIYPALNHDGITWKHVLGCVLSTGAFWSPERLTRYRAGRKELEEINQRIARLADELASLLDRRSELHNHSGFGDETLCAIHGVIDKASENNWSYQFYLKRPLAKLSSRYDLKYWPSLADCIRTIGADADRAKVTADNALTEAGTSSR